MGVTRPGTAREIEKHWARKVRMHHAHLFASDLQVSLEFYRRWFGAEVLGDEEFAGARNVMVRIGDGRLNFYDQAPRELRRNAVHHLGFQTVDLDGLFQAMSDGGVQFRNGVRSAPGGRYVMVEAPDGVLLELFEMDHGRIAPGVREWFAWQDEPKDHVK